MDLEQFTVGSNCKLQSAATGTKLFIRTTEIGTSLIENLDDQALSGCAAAKTNIRVRAD